MKTCRIYPNVLIAEGAKIGDYVAIGVPQKGKKEGELPTVIGRNAVIRSHSIIYSGNKIGDDFESGHYVFIREENNIGNGVRIGTHSIIEHHINIGNQVHIHSGVFIPEYSLLEDGCWLGPGSVLTNTPHPLCPNAKECLKRGCIIKRFAKVGANTTILPHVTIGDFSVIGAGSVVTQDIPSRKVAIGNPAKIIKAAEDLNCHYDKERVPYDI